MTRVLPTRAELEERIRLALTHVRDLEDHTPGSMSDEIDAAHAEVSGLVAQWLREHGSQR